MKIKDRSKWTKDEILWNMFLQHRGHDIDISTYGNWEDPEDICIECFTCNEVLIDAGIYTLCAREDEFK